MKHGRRPTRRQKAILSTREVDPSVWLIVKNLEDRLEIVHKVTGETKTINLGGYQ